MQYVIAARNYKYPSGAQNITNTVAGSWNGILTNNHAKGCMPSQNGIYLNNGAISMQQQIEIRDNKGKGLTLLYLQSTQKPEQPTTKGGYSSYMRHTTNTITQDKVSSVLVAYFGKVDISKH